MFRFLVTHRWPAYFGAMLVSLLGLARPARATHIVGGEMQLERVNGSTYTLNLNLYFDAVNGSAGALDPDLTASIFEKGTNRRMENIVLPLTSNTFVDYTNPACARPTLVTRKLLYSKSIDLPATRYINPQGYYVAVERCCRNNSINNIVLPSQSAQTFYLEFPAVVRNGQAFIDSTPRTFPPLADYACRGELFYYDFGGQDSDGDSLAYDLVAPLNGHSNANDPKPPYALPAPYTPITWNQGLTSQTQIPGAPTLGIVSTTGRLTVRPTSIGLFVFGVRCSEYRNGEKIGETRRDFQLKVLECPVNSTPSLVVSPATAAPSPTYRPGRDTLRLVPGGNYCLTLKFTDPDPSSQLTLSLNPVNYRGVLPSFTTATTGTVRASGMPDTLTATLCFSPCTSTNGQVNLLDVIVADNGCSLPRRDTVRVAFTAVDRPNSPPAISTTAGTTGVLQARIGDDVFFDVTGTDSDGDPVSLELSGRGFSPAGVGATLVSTTSTPTSRTSRFRWHIDCPEVRTAPYEFMFTAQSTACSGGPEAAAVSVPISIVYTNQAPALVSDLPAPGPDPAVPPVVFRPLDGSYTANFAGADADRDGLTLTATGRGFDLAEAGMRFTAQNGPGQASGTFHWDASCAAVNLNRELIVDFQLVDATCQPQPQSQSVRFEVTPPPVQELVLYNIITPGKSDNLNNEFRLPSLPPDFCDSRFATIKIYTRWGQQVFESPDRNFHWGGLGSGGIYYYLVTYTDGRKYKGWLEVVQ